MFLQFRLLLLQLHLVLLFLLLHFLSADIRLKEQQIEIESADKEERRRMEWAKIDNEVAQLEQRKREDETKRLVAAINKN